MWLSCVSACLLQVGSKVGASVLIRVNSTQDGAKPDQKLNMYLAYLKSYQHMGAAEAK
jgi:hypothetical protein